MPCGWVYGKDKIKEKNNYLTKKVTLSYKEKSTNLYIHYPKKQLASAKKIEELIHSKVSKIHEYFDYIPRSDVHIVSGKSVNNANGSATVFPRNQIFLHDYPPGHFDTLAYSKDWTEILFIHEYIHILTLEMTFGVLNFFRTFFGSTMKIGAIMPGWLAEGIAVWGESYFTGVGRIHHPVIQSELKKALQQNKNCHQFTCFDAPKHYPYRQYRYWLGGFYLDFIEKQKPGSLACLMKDQAKRIPLMLGGSFRRCTGKNHHAWYQDFRKNYLGDKEIESNYCLLKNKKNCELINKKISGVNWFKGHAESEQLLAISSMPNRS